AATVWLVGLAAVPALLTRLGGLPTLADLRTAIAEHQIPARLAVQLVSVVAWVSYAYLLGWVGAMVGLRRRDRDDHRRGWTGALASRLAALLLIAAGRVATTPPGSRPPNPPPITALARTELAAHTLEVGSSPVNGNER